MTSLMVLIIRWFRDGKTTLSASGVLLPESIIERLSVLEKPRRNGGVVVTSASVVESFLPVRRNATESLEPAQVVLPELIPEASVDVLVDQGGNEVNNGSGFNSGACWLKARLIALVNISAAAGALEQLVRNNGVPGNDSWDVGWSLAPPKSDPSSFTDILTYEVPMDVSRSMSQKITSATRIAFLEILATDFKCPPHVNLSLPQNGDNLLVMGSPFGILSPLHFFNSIAVGTVANLCVSASSYSSLLLADIRCLPGMEGAPVYDKHGHFVGIMTRPLRQKGCSAEIQLVITLGAIITACGSQSNGVHGFLPETDENMSSHHSQKTQSPLEAAVASVVLVTVGDGAWASGIILNDRGLVLTNAHLLEPWKYGRGSLLSITSKTGSPPSPFGKPIKQTEQVGDQGKTSLSSLLKASEIFTSDVQKESFQDSRYRKTQKLQIRLNQRRPWVWTDAKVLYISQGPIDIALLQLEDISQKLLPINIDYAPPTPGSAVHVVGHGPLGPRSDVDPYISSGVISRVVDGPRYSEMLKHICFSQAEASLPVMIETTAAVYPGMSGGAVINSDGRMVGLVTSNAKHGGGVIIPEINFSIPCAVLEPIFKFSVEQDPTLLEVYNIEDTFLSSIWALRPPQPTEPQLPLESKDKDAAKGSRFAEFLAKKQAENLAIADKEFAFRGRLPISKLPNSKL